MLLTASSMLNNNDVMGTRMFLGHSASSIAGLEGKLFSMEICSEAPCSFETYFALCVFGFGMARVHCAKRACIECAFGKSIVFVVKTIPTSFGESAFLGRVALTSIFHVGCHL